MIQRILTTIKKEKILVGLLILYGITRLYHLTLLPMFTDESIYIYWAKYIQETHAHWFISLYDGKPPLLILMITALLTVLPHDWYLIAGRLPSVFAGAMCLVGIYKLSLLLFQSKRVGIIAACIYIVFPFNLFYDRMALFDSLLTSMLVWSVYYCLKTAKTLSVKDAVLWGVFLGLGLLSKAPALLFVGLTPVAYAFFRFKTLKEFPWKKSLLLIGIAVGVSQMFYNIQRISGSFANMSIKNAQFQQPIDVLLKDPFQLLGGNVHQFTTWIFAYYTLPIIVLGIIAFVVLLREHFKKGLLLFLFWLVPMLALATIGREVYPRYIVFVTPYIIIPLAFFIETIWKSKRMPRVGIAAFLVVLFFLQLRLDYFFLTDPPKSALPIADYKQYISEHPSGYGLDKVFAFLDKEAAKGKIVVVTQGTFGLYPYAFQLHYWNNKNVTIVPTWPLDNIDQRTFDLRKNGTVYIVLKEHKFVPGHLLLRVLIRGDKPGSDDYPVLLTTFL